MGYDNTPAQFKGSGRIGMVIPDPRNDFDDCLEEFGLTRFVKPSSLSQDRNLSRPENNNYQFRGQK